MFALDGVAPLDGWAVAAIFAKAMGYGASLLAIGGPMFLSAFPGAAEEVRTLARRITIMAALAALAILAMRFGLRAARISGMGLEGAVDTIMLGLLWDGPLGDAALWQGVGAVLILGLALPGSAGVTAGLVGAGLTAVSFAFIGHALGEPRAVLGALICVHILAVAFWAASLAPLRRAAAGPDGAVLLHRFGIVASFAVAVLIATGGTFAWLVSGTPASLPGTAYGWTLFGKLTAVGGLLALAALNRWRLVPALAAGRSGTVAALRRSIKVEMTLIALVLVATATLTTVTTTPARL